MKRNDLTGMRFVRLTAIKPAIGAIKSSWVCECDCGATLIVSTSNLRSGNSKSCGCLVPDIAKGWNRTPEYTAFRNAKNRCERAKDIRYPQYGGRGIQFRFADMADFIACVGPRPSSKHSLDRIDPNGHYEPGNVRWATVETQSLNKSGSILIELDGVAKPLKVWCAESGQPYKRAWERIKDGWAPREAIMSPAGPTSHRQTVIHVEASE